MTPSAPSSPVRPDAAGAPPRSGRFRVISDNDYAGDPDGLVQLAHHALSPSIDLVGVIASHLPAGDPFDRTGRPCETGAEAAREVLSLAGRGDVRVVAGTQAPLEAVDPLRSAQERAGSAAVRLIVEEAQREDERPLFVCCGGGVSEIAAALLLHPDLVERLTVVWIGGAEHPGALRAPGAPDVEYNTAIDPAAARIVLSESSVPLWQVPRNAYREVIASLAELTLHLGTAGALGIHLLDALTAVHDGARGAGMEPGETYVLGDSPLVLLTALQTMFEPGPASSRAHLRPAPVLTADGAYSGEVREERQITVFDALDTALLQRDLYAKLALHARTETR